MSQSATCGPDAEGTPAAQCPDPLLACLNPVRAHASSNIALDGDDRDGLFEYLRRVPDPRRRRGVRHRLDSILATCVAAVLTGATSLLAIVEWVHDAPQEVLAALIALVSATLPLSGPARGYRAPSVGRRRRRRD